ncbi:MAG: AraC family transcriptional regulator [Clostridium sp.]|jgi:AraC-like DNA-binding protein|nr:AraC family transcriptional regulator [Clostridium sp.]
MSASADKGYDMLVEELDPTFLFTWKGTRNKTEDYRSHDFLELAFVLSGSGRYRIEGHIVEVAEGDLLLFNPGVRHQALSAGEGEFPATEFFVGFSDIQLQGYPRNFLPFVEGGYVLHTTGDLRQKLFKLCSSMEAENAVCRQGRYFMLKAYLTQLLLLVIREQFEPVQKVSGYSFESVNKKYVVEQILNYFEDHYREKISLDQIAENMYLSPFYLSKIFKSETGDTPIRHLINIRLERAKELLENGWGGSIQEVAACVGYDDAYHFSKLFKKKFGVPPSGLKRR